MSTGPVPDRTGTLRIGDRERSAAAERLSAHAAAGRLTMTELEERLELVASAVVGRDLLAVEADLPGPPARRRPAFPLPQAAIVCLVAGIVVSVLVQRPAVPLFLLAVFLWMGGPRWLLARRRVGV